jgi:hypothetical protein
MGKQQVRQRRLLVEGLACWDAWRARLVRTCWEVRLERVMILPRAEHCTAMKATCS